jgi:superfamily II DNA helicase RecQ
MYRIIAIRNNGTRSDMLIIVLLTGSSKSIFFLLPAILKGNRGPGSSINIIIILFITLANDLVTRARDFGINCMR